MIYGIFLSYHSKEKFLQAYEKLKGGAWKIEAFTPYAVEETISPEQISPVKIAGLIGAILGFTTGLLMQEYAAVIDTPLNFGGRPLNSWPAFVPVTWILTVLFSGVSIFISLWWKLGLPKPYHPVFNAQAYKLEESHFGILIRSESPSGSLPNSNFLKTLDADSQEEVPC